MSKKKVRKESSKKKGFQSRKVIARQSAKQVWWKNKQLIFPLAAILVFTLILYFPSLQHDFTNWDDDKYVTGNPIITNLNPDQIKEFFIQPVDNNYIPVTIFSFAVNYQLSGLNPFSYHLFNLLLHLLNTVLVFYFIYLISGKKKLVAFIVAFFFALHPMHVESVVWVTERKDLLYTFFFFLSLITYIRYIKQEKLTVYFLTFLFFLLSVLSKPSAVILPMILLLLDYFLNRKMSKRIWLEKIPFFALSLIMGILLLRLQSNFISMGELEDLNIFHKFCFGTYGFAVYILKLFVPYQLSSFHPYPDLSSGLPWYILTSPIWMILLAWLAWWSRKRTKIVVFGLLFYFFSIVLVLQFLSIGAAVIAERYTYVPYIGLLFIIASGYYYITQDKKKLKPFLKRGLPALLLIAALVYSYQTFNRIKVWKNSETLWTDVISKYPQWAQSYTSRGVYYLKNGQNEKAVQDLNMAISLNPKSKMAYFNRGNLFQRLANTSAALSDYNKAIEVDPEWSLPYINRGGIHFGQGDYEAAFKDYSKSISLAPDQPDAYANRAAIHYQRGQYENAITDYQKALAINPSVHKNYYGLGKSHHQLGQYQLALNAYNEAIRYNAEFGGYYLARARSYAALNNRSAALQDAQKARQLGTHVEDTFINSLR